MNGDMMPYAKLTRSTSLQPDLLSPTCVKQVSKCRLWLVAIEAGASPSTPPTRAGTLFFSLGQLGRGLNESVSMKHL